MMLLMSSNSSHEPSPVGYEHGADVCLTFLHYHFNAVEPVNRPSDSTSLYLLDVNDFKSLSEKYKYKMN